MCISEVIYNLRAKSLYICLSTKNLGGKIQLSRLAPFNRKFTNGTDVSWTDFIMY
jgi:hypothetical protein